MGGQPQGWYSPQQHPQQYQQCPQQSPHGQQPGYAPGGPPSPHPSGYPGAYPHRPGTAMAYVSAALFLPAVIMAFVSAVVGWSGTGIGSEIEVGLVFSLVGLSLQRSHHR